MHAVLLSAETPHGGHGGLAASRVRGRVHEGNPIRVLHLSYDGIQSAFESQTLGLARALRKAGVQAQVAVFTQPSAPDWREAVMPRVSDMEVACHVFLRPPFLGRVNLRLACLQVTPLVRRLCRDGQPMVLHCRGQMGTCLGLLIQAACRPQRIGVVGDIRGLLAEEIDVLAGNRATASRWRNEAAAKMRARRVTLAREFEAEACANSDAIVCVSQALKAHLMRVHDTAASRIAVVPTCTSFRLPPPAEQARRHASAKSRLGLEKQLVIAYCGSMHPWQQPDDIARAFLACRDVHEGAHLLVLSTPRDVAISALTRHGVLEHDCTILDVPHRAVPDLLAAADAGLLLRRPSVVNRVASPIKFAEYIAAGVPVIASRGIGDLDEIIPTHGLGALVDDPAEAAVVLGNLSLDHHGATEVLQRYFSWPRAVERLLGVYETAVPAAQKRSR